MFPLVSSRTTCSIHFTLKFTGSAKSHWKLFIQVKNAGRDKHLSLTPPFAGGQISPGPPFLESIALRALLYSRFRLSGLVSTLRTATASLTTPTTAHVLFFALYVCLSFAPIDSPPHFFFSSISAMHVKESLLCFRCFVLGRLSYYLILMFSDTELGKNAQIDKHVISSVHSPTKALYGSICSRK